MVAIEEKTIGLTNNNQTNMFFDHLFDDWKTIYATEENISFKLDLLEKFSSEIKEQIISGREKGFSKPYRASLINLLARLNDKKEALIKMEEDKNKTPEMLAQEAKEDSEAAYRLHKKFQSGLEIKAK
jgi:hypothetical protein